MFFFFNEENQTQQYHSEFFTRNELDMLLAPILGKSFEEIDKKSLFATQWGLSNREMNKGIFGNVIEQDVLQMKPDSKPRPDITIDYGGSNEAYRGIVKTEVKTTGMVENENGLVPKERVSVTGISIGIIENETWETSRYYHKLCHILWIFYLYKYKGNNKELFTPYEQKNFKILNYGFQHLADDQLELAKFEKDWKVIHDYLVLHKNDPDKETNWYPMLHQNTKHNLIYTDIAPRYPNRPRLAFKSTYVSTVYDMLVKKAKYESLSFDFSSIYELEIRLHTISAQLSGKTISELAKIFDIPTESKKGKKLKNLTEPIAIRIFDKNIKKLNRIDVFCKAGINLKTMTVNTKGGKTEDCKLFLMNVEEFRNTSLNYEHTTYYNYFRENRFLFIIFEEVDDRQPNQEHKFLGFKWFDFDTLERDCKETFDAIRNRIVNNTLKNEFSKMYKGKPTYAPNFPKSANNNIFVRGSSTAAVGKNWNINGIEMYAQHIWIKGAYLSETFKKTPFI